MRLLNIAHRPFVAFCGSLVLGLALAFAIGAAASSRHSSLPNSASQALVQREANRAARPDTAVMSVFRRAVRPSDAVPASIANTMSQFAGAPVSSSLKPGAAVSSAARRAMTDVGPAAAALYLVPTSSGSLCMLWSPDVFGGGCTQGFDANTHAIYLRGSVDGKSYVWGILRDDVSAITAIVNGATTPVVSGQNAFFYLGESLPSALRLSLANGTTQTLTIGALPGALK